MRCEASPNRASLFYLLIQQTNMKKTYGIFGKMEQILAIKAGAATLQVHFVGGSMTPYGTIPATFTTSNELWQAVIEHSKEFKSGLVKLVCAIGEPAPKLEAHTEAPKVDVSGEATQGTLDLEEPVEEPVAEADWTTVTVAGKEDAAEYLRQNFDLPTRLMRSVAAVKRYGAEHKVKFVGI